MPWLDPARQDESAEDRELRAELRGLVGLPMSSFESNFFGAEPTPELVKLAESLRTEALRRRNTSRRRPLWMLMAAGLPVALVLSGLSFWGVQQKHRADELTRAAAVEKAKGERAGEASTMQVSRDREGRSNTKTAAASTVAPLNEPGRSGQMLASNRDPKSGRPKATGTTTFKPNSTDYPVIEVKQPLALPPVAVDRVKAQ